MYTLKIYLKNTVVASNTGFTTKEAAVEAGCNIITQELHKPQNNNYTFYDFSLHIN